LPDNLKKILGLYLFAIINVAYTYVEMFTSVTHHWISEYFLCFALSHYVLGEISRASQELISLDLLEQRTEKHVIFFHIYLLIILHIFQRKKAFSILN